MKNLTRHDHYHLQLNIPNEILYNISKYIKYKNAFYSTCKRFNNLRYYDRSGTINYISSEYDNPKYRMCLRNAKYIFINTYEEYILLININKNCTYIPKLHPKELKTFLSRSNFPKKFYIGLLKIGLITHDDIPEEFTQKRNWVFPKRNLEKQICLINFITPNIKNTFLSNFENNLNNIHTKVLIDKPNIIRYILNKIKTILMCEQAVQINGLNLIYVPYILRTKRIINIAIKNNGLSLVYVLYTWVHIYREFGFGKKTKKQKLVMLPWSRSNIIKLCEKAVVSNGDAIRHVPKDVIHKLMCVTAIEYNANNIRFVPHKLQDLMMCREAIIKDPRNIKYVSKIIREEIYNENFLIQMLQQHGKFISIVAIKKTSYQNIRDFYYYLSFDGYKSNISIQLGRNPYVIMTYIVEKYLFKP